MSTEIGTYVLPVIVSMRGIDAQVNQKLRKALGSVGDQAGGDFTDAAAKKIGGSSSQQKMKVALAQSLRATGASEAAGKEFADNTSVAIAKHMQSAQNQQRVASSLGFLQTHGDQAGRDFADKMATRLGIDLPNKTKAQRIGERVGQIIAAPMGLAIRGGLLAAAGGAAAGVAGIGYVLTKGFQRLESIDTAQFKLKALGHGAAEVKTIMDNALKSVKGTSFGLDAAATAAASAVAAGIKPGEQLTKYLTEIADTAAVAGTSFEDMGHIFDKVQTQNKAYTDDLNMLSDRGIPIFKWLQEEYGVTAEALTAMVQGGEVDAAHFQDAIDKHIGGAALTMGQSFAGSVENAKAAIGRLGEAFLKPVFGKAAGGIGSITGELDNLTKWVDNNQEKVISFFQGIGDAAVYMGQSVLAIIGGTAKGLAEFVNAFGDTYGAMTRSIAAVNRVLGRTEIADQLDADADAAFGWADGLYKISDTSIAAADNLGKLHGSLETWAESARNAADNVTTLSGAIGQLAGQSINVPIKVDTSRATADMDSFFSKWTRIITAGPNASPPPGQTAPPGFNPLIPAGPAGRASGGSIFGAGTGTSDSVPIMASHGEHMWTASEVNKVGGQANMYRLRSLARKGALRGFAGGGALDYLRLADIVAPKDPGRNADRSRPSMGGGDRGPRGTMNRKGPFNFGGNDSGVSIWPGGGGIGGSAGDGGHWFGNEIHWPDWMFPGLNKSKRIKMYKDGGEVNADWFTSVAGSPYQMGGFGSTFDCTGAVSGGVNVLMGRQWNQGPPGGSARMATGSEAEWLASQGFVMGVGPPGSVRVGWVNGGPGGGHSAMTLPDGRNFESSSGNGVRLGGNANGASDPMFTQHAYLPAGPQLNPNQGSPGSRSAGSTGSSSSSGGKSVGSTQSLSDVASGAVKIGIDGLMESIGADGSFLPENLGIPKTLMAALGLKINTAAGSFSLADGWQPKAGAATAGGTSDSPFGMQTTMPQIGSPASGNGLGPAPGPVDQSTNITLNSPQGDTTDLVKRVKTAVAPSRVDTHMPAGF